MPAGPRRRDCTPRGSAAILGALLVLLAAPALAQDDPLSDPRLLDGVDRAALDRAAPSRRACRSLADLVNTSVARWEQVRAGTVDRAEHRDLRRTEERRWTVVRGDCAEAILQLEDGPARRVLDREVELVTASWDALRDVGRQWQEQRGREAIDSAAERYAEAAARYAEHVDRARAFWEGRALAPARAKTCVDDLESALSDLSGVLRRALAGEEAGEDLRPRWDGLERSRTECRAAVAEPGERVRLDLLGELLVVHQELIAGIAEPTDLRKLLEREQAVTSRIARCAREHDAGELSSWCRPR